MCPPSSNLYDRRNISDTTRRLQDMTLEELWELFPIVLEEHNPAWPEWAKDEINNLQSIFLSEFPVINHIGSTAIPSIISKPVVDILVEVSKDIDWQNVKSKMDTNGYICMSESGKRISFNKGYTLKGYAEKVFHIHFHRIGDNAELLFRNYLLSHPDKAKEYERLKKSLLPRYKNDRAGYTEAKTSFIKSVLALAENERGIGL